MFEELEVKGNSLLSSDTPTFKSTNEVRALVIKHSIFSIMAGLIVEIFFMVFSVYNDAV